LYVKRELFLALLLLLYVLLLIVNNSLLGRTLKLIDYESLSAIISFFILSRGLELSGVFTRIAPYIIQLSDGDERRFLFIMIVIVSLSSSLIMNDTAMFVFIPLIMTMSKIAEIDVKKAVSLTAIAANVGSALTPIGNPQNIIMWRVYRISVHEFILTMLPYVSIWVFVLLLFVFIGGSKKQFRVFTMPDVKLNKALMFSSATLFFVDVVLIQLGHALWALPLTLAILVIVERRVLLSIDIALILTFAFIFIDFKELSTLMQAFNILPSLKSSITVVLLSTGLSQLISNVPATVVLISAGKPEWLPLALGVNLGGTGIVIGSLANLIALRISGIRIRDFHRFSIPYFLIALGFSFLILLL